MLVTGQERHLCQVLRDLPREHGYRYESHACHKLQRTLFRSLVANNDDYLWVLFRGKVPKDKGDWKLRKAQGMTEDMEYTEAARGKSCGHIFKSGDSVYRCKTCTLDETCVLCTRCFEASDHTGHIFTQSISLGNSGCCDCGDDEAWKIPVKCAIHTANGSTTAGKKQEPRALPDELLECIRMTIGRAMDYLIDVISCSPENLRFEKTEQSIRQDEEQARLDSVWYDDPIDENPEFALVLWNDEKHTVPEVERQVARACKKRIMYGTQKANEINDTGRSVVEWSKDVQHLLKIAEVIEQIKLTVTIRSSRDTFREQMCGTIIEWLGDVAGCSVGEDHDILRHTVCEEMLKSWRMGSEASNRWIGTNGLDDHEIDEAVGLSDTLLTFATRRGPLAGRLRLAQIESDSDAVTNDNDNDDEDDEAESQANEDDEVVVQMDLDMSAAGIAAMNTDRDRNRDRDLEMHTPGELEDETEVSEATYAGYPPPPPPPPAPPQVYPLRNLTQNLYVNSESGGPSTNFSLSSNTGIEIPTTEWRPRKKMQPHPPSYWVEQPEKAASREPVPLHEDLHQRVRLDWLLLYDLRLWKQVRIDLRDLYISTVVTVPRFKRIIGLRFAGLYSVLAQLYLVADREPDHSIINLSVQTFTTPSITKEAVERGNFLTTLFSILYTFLTKRTVQHPWQVSLDDTLAFDHGAVANRRMYHFFQDLKHLFGIEYIQEELRMEERYVLQFLDLIRLPQGICPNVRAVGDHVEYESDVWIAAQLLTKEINKLCRQFAETFEQRNGGDSSSLSRVIRVVAKATVVNSVGAERFRFDQAEIKGETRFKTLSPFFFESSESVSETCHSVVDFVVETEPISFHHALHYALSWLIDAGKSMSKENLKDILRFTADELKKAPPYKTLIPDYEPEDYLMALFDFPLRVCAWLAQMKAGMWVRNGLSLRHQMTTYRGVSHRDWAHHRDIFLLQTALVTCRPNRVLASMIERFGMDDWMRGIYVLRDGYELNQQLDVAEDFIHLLIVLLSDRTSLQPLESNNNMQALAIRRDIAHILCFKPLSFSELNNRFADKATDLEEFQDILEEMTIYRPPEGLSDTGSFELRREYLADVDPYTAHYTKNQRDDAENAYRAWISNKSGKSLADIVYEPKLRPIRAGIFMDLSLFTQTPLFAQIIFYSLACGFDSWVSSNTPITRIEAYLQVVLHLVLAAVLEDDMIDDDDSETPSKVSSFVYYALNKKSELGHTIFDMLIKVSENEEIKSCHPKVRLILHRIRQKRPYDYDNVVRYLYADGKQLDKLGFESPRTPMDEDHEEKQRQARELRKRQALDRQAKVMAQFQQQQQNFLNNQDISEWEEDVSDDIGSAVTGLGDEQKKSWKYPTGNCILCQEETNDTRLFGTFALMTNSTIFRQTDIRDPDFLGEVLKTPSSLDSSADDIRPFGIAGQNRSVIKKRASDGHEFASEHQGLGKGFPPLFLARVPVSSGCGHIMHFSCFDMYCTATERRQSHQIARNHPERLALKEFVCPLCKALGNSFLPIIWRGKDEAYPGVLQTESTFQDWLSFSVGPTVSRFFKSQDGGRSRDSRRQDLFISYISKAVIPPLASRLSPLMNTPLSSPISPRSSSRSSLLAMPGFFPTEEGTSMFSPSHALPIEQQLISELVSIYTRLRDTLKSNKLGVFDELPTNKSTSPLTSSEDLDSTDKLGKMLGHSIAAAEIAQRGVQSEPGHTLVEKIPSSVLTHLRILSETVSSYIAIGGIRNSGTNAAAFEFSEATRNQVLQLFAGHHQIVSDLSEAVLGLNVPAALSQDPFVLLAECSITLVPAINLDIHHIMRLCYLLEIVKVTLYLTTSPDTFEACRVHLSEDYGHRVPSKNVEALQRFVSRIAAMSTPHWPMMDYQNHPFGHMVTRPTSLQLYGLLYDAVTTYALTFVRKATILLNVRYGVDYPATGLSELNESELSRLSKILRLPFLLEIFMSLGDDANTGSTTLADMIGGWIQHWQINEFHQRAFAQPLPLMEGHAILKSAAYGSLRLGHPAIFELIGLPKHFDTLTYEVTRRRCPTTGNKLEDAALCLFCGALFCSQALCCSNRGKGGCNQHMQK